MISNYVVDMDKIWVESFYFKNIFEKTVDI